MVNCLTINAFADSTTVGVTYDAHVQNIGWQNPWSNDGGDAGTIGQALRIEALKIRLTNAPAGARIKYSAYVENSGWQNYVYDGTEAGTEGQSLKIEAVKISLENMPGYTVQYQVHVQNIGWQSWQRDGNIAGTTNQGLRIESIRIKVLPIVHTTSLSLNKTSVALPINGTYKLIPNIYPSNATDQDINWISSNNSVVTVDNQGNIKGVAAGNAYITATTADGNFTAICNVSVYTVGVTGISLNKTSDSIPVGYSDTLSANISPSNATNQAVSWTSSNSSVATVDNTGKVTGISIGTATITATSNDGSKIATCQVTIFSAPVTGISLNKTTDTLAVGGTDTLIPNITPTYASNKNVIWTSSNNSVVTVDSSGKLTGVSLGTAIITAATADGNKTAACTVTVANPSITYEAHVQNIGWQNPVSDGATAGTVGQALRMEALKINLINAPEGARIKYQAYVQNIGWQDSVYNGDEAGTDNQGLRVEALRISLENMPGYSIEYRAQVQNIGWQPWIMDGNLIGTEGRSLQIESLQIKLLKNIDVQYQTQVQNIGWQAPVTNGAITGTDGQPLRLEAFNIKLLNPPSGVSIKYQAHVQNIGWQDWTNSGDTAGTVGQSLRVEALRIQLVNTSDYTVEYQVFVENKGWQNWVTNGQTAGTQGSGLRIEGLRIRVVSNPDITITSTPVQTPTAYRLTSYLDSNANITSVNNTATALHYGVTMNNCVYFSSEALRRIGFNVPIWIANTKNYIPYLLNNGWKQYFSVDDLAPGDICFTVPDYTGYSSHTYVFMGWVNPDDHTLAYVADNQNYSNIHIRSIIDAPNFDAFAFFVRY